jgi:hypothetical protein
MNPIDAYLVGSYTEFLVLMPYLVEAHEEKGLISTRERALREIKRILDSNGILTHIVDEISDSMAKLERYPKLGPELKSQDVHELGKAASKWRDEISRELGR